MDFNYEEYEKKCQEIRGINDEILELFASDLENLSPKTVRKHVNNVDFYINDYLLYEDALTFDYGTGSIDGFLGDFFIRKCTWSTPETIRSTAASIKKFYKCMVEHGKIERKEYDYLCDEVKMRMPKWQADCAQFNTVEEDSPFDFF